MKLGHIVLIIITSIIVAIGVMLNKVYEKFIKTNTLIQMLIYMFWTLLALRILQALAKPLIGSFIKQILNGITNVLSSIGISLQNLNIDIQINSSVIIVLLLALILAMSTYNVRRAYKDMGE